MPQPAWIDASDGTYYDRVYIFWSAVTGANHYHLFRDSTQIGGEVASTAYNDFVDGVTMVRNTVYSYKVRAVAIGSGGEELLGIDPPNFGWAGNCPFSGPEEPTILTFVARRVGPATGSCSGVDHYSTPLDILWRDNAPGLSNGALEEGFRVYDNGGWIATVPSWTGTSAVPDPNTIPYTCPSLKDYTPSNSCGVLPSVGCHTFEVKSFCTANVGLINPPAPAPTTVIRESAAVSDAICTASAEPNLSVSYVAGPPQRFDLLWTYTPQPGLNPSGPNGYLFDIYRCPSSPPPAGYICDTCNTIFLSGTSATNYSDNTVTSNNYCYKVKALSNVCPYPCNLPTNTPTPTCAPACPSAPINLQGNCTSGTSVDLSWSLGLPNGWGTTCSQPANNSFTLYVAPSYTTSTGLLKDQADVQTYSLASTDFSRTLTVDDGKQYYWQVKADNGLVDCAVDGPLSIQTYSSVDTFLCGTVNDWFQTQDGNLHAQGRITSRIPNSCTGLCSPACVNHLSLDGLTDIPGIVSYGDSINVGDGDISSQNWQAKTTYNGPLIKYNYLINKLNVDKSNLLTCDLGSCSSGTYYRNGNLEVLSAAALGTKKIVIFVNGNVDIKANITVDTGGFLAIVAKGNIEFSNSVTRADGFYSADGILITASGASQFIGQGSFIGWQGVSLNRDLGNDGNKCTPAERFIARPDFYINAPASWLSSQSYFQEMEP